MRPTVAALMLAASNLAMARNAAAPWDDSHFKSHDEEDHEERFSDFAESIAFWGYGWEPFEVSTRDGFKLTLFRITNGPPEGFVKPEIPSSSSSEAEQEVDNQ